MATPVKYLTGGLTVMKNLENIGMEDIGFVTPTSHFINIHMSWPNGWSIESVLEKCYENEIYSHINLNPSANPYP